MKRYLLLLLLLFAVGCNDSSTGPSGWTRWKSTAWAYSYTEPGYTEGLQSVVGQLYVERSADSIRVGAVAGDVYGNFWGTLGTDTTIVTGRIWPAQLVVRGVVTVAGDTTRIVNSNYPAWVVPGYYVSRGDTLTYSLIQVDSTRSMSLVVTYVR